MLSVDGGVNAKQISMTQSTTVLDAHMRCLPMGKSLTVCLVMMSRLLPRAIGMFSRPLKFLRSAADNLVNHQNSRLQCVGTT
jgi:hypothetical protein